jgi:hypothetical protein
VAIIFALHLPNSFGFLDRFAQAKQGVGWTPHPGFGDWRYG